MGNPITPPPPSFRRQFIRLALSVILWSAAASVLIWSLLAVTALQFFRPANYYEKQLPDIIRYAEEAGPALLDPAHRLLLERHIPSEGITYRVVPVRGGGGYGSLSLSENPAPDEWIRKVNTAETRGGAYFRYVPLADAEGRLRGVLVLRYRLSFLAVNDSPLAAATLFVFMAAPFAFLAFFTYWFGRRLEKRIAPALEALMDGAARVEKADLDFSMGEVGGTRELSALGSAFEKMRASLRASLEKQWRMEQARREMVAALAHDLFTPLTVILGHAENLLNREPPGDERRYRWRTIRTNAERAIRLVKEMQEATRLEQPGFSLEPSPLDIRPFLEQKTEEYRSLCAEKAIRLHTRVEDRHSDPSRPMRVDSHRLSQILDNIMANAIRFTPAGGEIRWQILLEDGGLEIAITDTGPGLSEKDRRFVFDRFYRGDPARGSGSGHAGLGMYIAKTLAEKHGGWITAGNGPEGGAQFRFRIAELAGDAKESPHAGAGPISGPPDGPLGRR